MSVFQTKAWQSAWWDTWGQQSGFRLIRSWDGEVSGLYQSRYRLKGLLPIKSLQFVGTSLRELRTPRTEYNRFFMESNDQFAISSLERLLGKAPWSEAVFGDLCNGSEELTALVKVAERNNWGFRVAASDMGYAVSTAGSFADYLSSLGANSRLRLYNRRKVLESLGKVREENLWPDNQEVFFAALNNFHQARWKKDCFDENSLAFHKKFLSRVEEEGGIPMLSALSCDDHMVSLLYNVWYRGIVYNIQAGFEEKFHRKVSLGSLHLGYAIENAFNCSSTNRFDLLAGEGRKEDYKARFANQDYQLISIVLVKSPLLRALYWIKDNQGTV